MSMDPRYPSATPLNERNRHNKRTHSQMSARPDERPRPIALTASSAYRPGVLSFEAFPGLGPASATHHPSQLSISTNGSTAGVSQRTENTSRSRPLHPTVIDLTEDDPVMSAATASTERVTNTLSTMQEVIDVDALPDRPAASPDGPHTGRIASPEVQFTFARQVHPRPRPDGRRTQPSVRADAMEPNTATSIGRGMLGVDFGHLRRFTGPSVSQMMPSSSSWYGMDYVLSGFNRTAAAVQSAPRHQSSRFNPATALSAFLPPENLPYETIALAEESSDSPAPTPTYEAPKPARNGYTRFPQEDEVVLCPSCDEELGVGESKEKRSVWFVKGCGHVFCGECTLHRGRSSSKKTEPKNRRGRPFKYCPVCEESGIKTSVSHRDKMKQIFL